MQIDGIAVVDLDRVRERLRINSRPHKLHARVGHSRTEARSKDSSKSRRIAWRKLQFVRFRPDDWVIRFGHENRVGSAIADLKEFHAEEWLASPAWLLLRG